MYTALTLMGALTDWRYLTQWLLLQSLQILLPLGDQRPVHFANGWSVLINKHCPVFSEATSTVVFAFEVWSSEAGLPPLCLPG